MKKLVFASLCLLSIASYGQSNKFAFQLGSDYELPRKTDDLAFFGNSTDGIINLSMKKDELNIVRFDAKSLAQTDDKVIALPEATRNFNSEGVTSLGKNYYWIHSDWDKESGKEYLYYDKVDVAGAKLTSQNNKMIEATKIAGTETMSGLYNFKVTNKYDFNYSADHQKLLVTYRLTPKDRSDKVNHDVIGFFVFDENMNKIWGNEFTMPYTEAIMDNSDFSVDSKGNAYLLAKVYDDERRKEKDKETGKAGYHYEVLKFTKDNKNIVHTAIGIGDYFIKEASLIESPTHDMIIASTYSKKSKGDGTDGVFLATLNQNGEVVKYKNGYYEFPVADLEKFESNRKKRKMENKDDYEAPNLKVRDIAIQADGSIFLTCEEFYIVTNYRTDSYGHTTVTYTYYYDDIIASKINADGKFAWVRKIPKRQRGSRGEDEGLLIGNSRAKGAGSMGFKLITDGTDYYFLFLDNKKNMDLAEDEAPKYHVDGFGGQVVVVKLDKDGNMSKELLFDTKEEKVMIFPTRFSKINSNQFIGRAKLKKRNNFEPLLITVK